MKKKSLWSRNYTLLMLASACGAAGGILSSYAMSFFVFEKTGSTLAAGLLSAMQIVPHFLVPILVSPIMDRLPRKPVLVLGDLAGAVLYGLVGLYLLKLPFSYGAYLVFSLIINCVNALDSLAFNCIFPKVIPEGFTDQGYTVSAMLYPVLNVLMMPLAALLMDSIGAARILLIQCGLSVLAALSESRISVKESRRLSEDTQGIKLWLRDLKEGFCYLKGEKGLLAIRTYDAIANGMGSGYGPIMVAFFRTARGFHPGMYAIFSGAEFIGRTLGGIYRYRTTLPKQKRQKFVYSVQQFYNGMDACLLWLPYPLMLLNRSICGFLGINSATVRESSVQKYIPEEFRARINAFSEAAICVTGCASSLLLGALGEVMDYKIVLTVAAAASMLLCKATVGGCTEEIRPIYEADKDNT